MAFFRYGYYKFGQSGSGFGSLTTMLAYSDSMIEIAQLKLEYDVEECAVIAISD